MRDVKMIVACEEGSHGNGPDFYFCIVRCTEEQYNEGLHYSAAMAKASGAGNEGPMVAIAECDPPQAVFTCFVWESATTVDITGDTA